MILTTESDIDFLRTPSSKVEPGDPQLNSIIHELLSDVDRIGLGLAAIQIGYQKAITVMKLYPDRPYVIAINPRFMAKTGKVLNREGCLSIPDKHYWVPRSPHIVASWMDIDFKVRTETLKGLSAFIFQHETGHTQGKLISDIGTEV
jgi:peptide deformylase